MKRSQRHQRRTLRGFTLVEIIVVVVLLAIVSLTAIPVLSSAADMQVRSAADKIAADLDYAKGLAITHQKTYTVVFAPSEEKYQVQDSTGTILKHPLRNGDFIEDFTKDRRVKKVNIVSTNLSGNAVTFDYLGTPYAGTGTSSPLNAAGEITLQADSFTLVVKIEPVTGYVSIEKTTP
jgi:prepilin-type N-terminal cleavage/methylation domain-containing protein